MAKTFLPSRCIEVPVQTRILALTLRRCYSTLPAYPSCRKIIHHNRRAKSGTKWSSPAIASVTISDTAALQITELMYNPAEGKAMEYVEIKNTSGSPVPLSGVSLTGVNFTFSDGILAPWRSGVIISNDDPIAFSQKHPNANILGTFGGALSNGGEEVTLLDPDGQRISSVRYSSDALGRRKPMAMVRRSNVFHCLILRRIRAIGERASYPAAPRVTSY